MVQLAQKRKTQLAGTTATWHLHLKGRVQGVGFRPYVYQMAVRNNVSGSVRNDADGVHVVYNAPDLARAETFARLLIDGAPKLSIITGYDLVETDFSEYNGFEISESQSTTIGKLMITPDLALCEDCRRELSDTTDRRFQYPFITCTNCGPRYSILSGLPYDRPNTSMAIFEMCPECSMEYHNIIDRRHYSQTNSCPECPVRMTMFDRLGQVVAYGDDKAIMKSASSAILRGEVVALKGVGGFLLMADATNESAVGMLRLRKRRARKPFAVMYPDVKTLASDVELTAGAVDRLLGPESPILLLPIRKNPVSGIAVEQICPALSKMGVMMPYTGVFEMLMRELKRPVVATSGNISDSPIIYRDSQAVDELAGLADFIITNDRQIRTAEDDSVMRLRQGENDAIILRRSRGLAPSLRHNPIKGYNVHTMASGADLKGAFGLAVNDEIYVSQYLGNLEYLGSQSSYKAAYLNLAGLLNFRPECVVCDLHPGYFSSEIADGIAIDTGAVKLQVQHHVAHFCSVLGENDLLDTKERVLGVVWDGTGFGMDGNVWGGEYFLYESGQLARVAHHDYFPHLLGDKMSREPRLAAYAMLRDRAGWQEHVESMFSSGELMVYRSVAETGLGTSSTGRLFDAVASVLGLCQVMDYEGEAAILLEECAAGFLAVHGDDGSYYSGEVTNSGRINFDRMFDQIRSDLDSGMQAGQIALRFHRTLVRIVECVAGLNGARIIAFSGGVFQNALLAGMLSSLKMHGYHLHFHNELSPNDENIAHGQLVYAFLKSRNPKLKFSK